MNRLKLFLKSPPFILILLSLFLVSIWFSDKTILATAEEGIPFYNSLRTFSLYKSVWIEAGLGYVTPFFLPRLVMYSYAAGLEYIGIQSWLIQASIFFFLLNTALISMYHLSKKVFPCQHSYFSITASLFYLFNLYTLSQVFGRFLYPLIFSWAYLPLFLILWILWIESGKKRYLFWFILTNFLYADAFGLVSSVFVFWVPAAVITLVLTIQTKERFSFIKNGFIGLSLWIVSNIWWLYPLYNLRNTGFAEKAGNNANFSSLVEVSKYFSNKDILLLKQKFMFGEQSVWFDFYNQEKIVNIGWVIALLVFFGIYKSRKNKYWLSFIIVFLIGWFISKGTNVPFGESFFSFLFTWIPITQVLRNPYEKFGIVFLLPFSIFFSYGLWWLLDKFKENKLIPGVFAMSVFSYYLVFPLWEGSVFPDYVNVSVPSYYAEMNQLIEQSSTGRILHLPFFNGSYVKYDWNYQGEEPSEYLFANSSLSKVMTIPSLDDIYLILPKYYSDLRFGKVLAMLNVDTILVHSDYKLNTFYDGDVESSMRLVKSWNVTSNPEMIGRLTLFNYNGIKLNKVYAANNVTSVSSLDQGLLTVLTPKFDINNSVFVINNPSVVGSGSIPNISYKQISASRYVISVTDAKEPFILVLTESYNPLWTNLLATSHVKVNGYANGWVMEKKGDYQFEVVYKVWPWE